MKRYLIAILAVLLLCPCAWAGDDDSCSDPMQLARMNPAVLGSVGSAAAGCGSCGSDIIFNWKCTSAADISSGGGCNASAADCAVSLGTGAAISSGVLSMSGATQTASTVTISGASATSGSVTYSFKTTGYGSPYNQFTLVCLKYNDTNYVSVTYCPNTDKIWSNYVSNGTKYGTELGTGLTRNTAHSIKMDWAYTGNITITFDTINTRSDTISAAMAGAPVQVVIGGNSCGSFPVNGDSWEIDDLIVYGVIQ